jgi:hypothetical protein
MVPAFSWIAPNNCSDAHDTTCKGNNLSGAFGTNLDGTVNLNDPIYHPAGLPAFDPEATTPRNFTGGLYASDLFLAYYVPLIEDSAAYAHGLIDITFDEGEPSFTYSGNSFNNVQTAGPNGTGTTGPLTPADAPTFGSAGSTAPGANSIYGAYGISADAAGENISGTNVGVEPYGPNSTLGTTSSGDQLYPGPGNNAFIDRPPVCTSPSTPVNCVPGIVRGGSGTSPGARTDGTSAGVSGSSASSTIIDNSIIGDDTGRGVSGTGIPGSSFVGAVGAVTDSGPLFPTNSGGPTVGGSFQLVDAAGNPVLPTATVTSITFSAECANATNDLPTNCAAGQTKDPLYDAVVVVTRGAYSSARTFTPGTVSTTDYNHYSWLRTVEDLFVVSHCAGTAADITLPAGTVCGGLDGTGHLGYAAQVGLTGFGTDVFTAPDGNGFQQVQPPNALPEAPLVIAIPALAGILFMGGFLLRRRRRGLVH